MAVKVAVTRERSAGETRVAITPDSAKKLIALGVTVVVETGAGAAAACTDADYRAAGAAVVNTLAEAIGDADVLLKVRAPEAEEIAILKPGAIVAAMLNPHGGREALRALADKGVTAFAMEFIPRITRAQVMDVLSSQANLAGYRAVIEGAEAYGKAMPMMMTAAGTVAPAKVFIMGVGVAGLQAIATARRLGAVVTATDVRPARLGMPRIFTPLAVTATSPSLAPSTLPPCSMARSTITDPAFMEATWAALTSLGARRPGMRAVVITMSCLAR